MEKLADYRPTTDETRSALVNFHDVIDDSSSVFKIGRCDITGFETLKHRDMYADHAQITEIWRGSAQKASWLERNLTQLAWKNYPARCANEQAGGGDVGIGTTHCVYVVEWAPTAARVIDVWYNSLMRDSPDQ
jgi:hypothetical protein